MKPEDLRPCALCRKGVMHTGLPLCYRVTVDRIGFDQQAIRQLAGLETMLGSVALARVMSPVSEVGKAISRRELLVCEECSTDSKHAHILAIFAELGEEKPV